MKRLVMMTCAAAMACGAMASSITVDSVVQRWPWNNKVDITYTVRDGQVRSAGVYYGLRFALTANGQTYRFEGSAIGASAESGADGMQHTVTWTAPEGIVCADCSLTATLFPTNVPSGNDYMVVGLASGDVAYEGLFRTQAESNARYNTADYKTTKLVLRRIPRTADSATLPNGPFASGYPTGDDVNNPYQNHSTTWTTDRDYYIGVFPVTQAQYQLIYGSKPAGVKTTVIAGNEVTHRPVENASWLHLRSPYNDNSTDFAPTSSIPAVATFTGTFFQRLNYRTGLYFDLPTEVMFEIALRAGATTTYYWGDSPDSSRVWCRETAGKDTAMGGTDGCTVAVGLLDPNDWGLYEMAGNVLEWCLDDSSVTGVPGYLTSRPDVFTPCCGEFPSATPKRRTRGGGDTGLHLWPLTRSWRQIVALAKTPMIGFRTTRASACRL